jgi:CBS domain containing-hemolysin-like protein
LNKNTYVFEGKTLLSDFCRILEVGDDEFAEVEGDADTVAGLLLEIKGDFPVIHEKLEFQNYLFEIMELEERRISRVKVVVRDRNTDLPE